MTYEGLWKMFEGDSADTCAGKFPLVLMGGRAEGLACADPGARTPSALAKILLLFSSLDLSSHVDLHHNDYLIPKPPSALALMAFVIM